MEYPQKSCYTAQDLVAIVALLRDTLMDLIRIAIMSRAITPSSTESSDLGTITIDG